MLKFFATFNFGKAPWNQFLSFRNRKLPSILIVVNLRFPVNPCPPKVDSRRLFPKFICPSCLIPPPRLSIKDPVHLPSSARSSSSPSSADFGCPFPGKATAVILQAPALERYRHFIYSSLSNSKRHNFISLWAFLSTAASDQRSPMAEEGWSDLPYDILGLIVEHLPVADASRFRSVCSSWSSAPPPLHTPLEIPWLLLYPTVSQECGGACYDFEQSKDNQYQHYMRFYSIPDNRIYKLGGVGSHLADIMLECLTFVSYSPGGWLMYMDKVCELQCVHLHTGERIYPPSITTFPDVYGVETDSQGGITGFYIGDHGSVYLWHRLTWFYETGIIIFSGSPPDHLPTTEYNSKHLSTANTGCPYVIVVAYHFSSKLAFARKGDAKWTLLNVDPPLYNVCSLMLHKGSLYAVTNCGSEALRYGFNSDLSFRSHTRLPFNFRVLAFDELVEPTAYLIHIDGYLCLIVRSVPYSFSIKEEPSESGVGVEEEHNRFYDHKTSSFRVYKYDEIQATWVEMESIGEYAIFVGNNQPLALSTQDLPCLTRDCIYFTEDDHTTDGSPTWWGIGVFNLQDQSTSSYHDGPASVNFLQPSWVTPFSSNFVNDLEMYCMYA